MIVFKQTLLQGWYTLRANNQLLLVAILLFVFPLVFVYILHGFLNTAKINIETTQKQVISQLHDSISYILQDADDISSFLAKITQDSQTVANVQIVSKQEEGFEVIATSRAELDSVDEQIVELLLNLPAISDNQSVIFETNHHDSRVWYAFRKVITADTVYFIVSEHDFTASDSVLLARERQAFTGLTVVFAFIIALAYWVFAQTNWAARYAALLKTLNERDSFVHMVAHEFRTPLTAIKGYASLLQDSKSVTEEEARYVDNIRISSERLVHLVNDFLEVARIQAGKLNLQKQLVDIETVLVRVCDELRPLALEKTLHLVYHKKQQSIKLHTDPDRLEQILTNVITNAIKYTETGSVEVEAVQLPHKVVLRIKDTGVGMSATDQRKLFTQFTRVGKADQSNVIGSGLGMWITKQLVEVLGGSIEIESIEKVGTHVIVTFPH